MFSTVRLKQGACPGLSIWDCLKYSLVSRQGVAIVYNGKVVHTSHHSDWNRGIMYCERCGICVWCIVICFLAAFQRELFICYCDLLMRFRDSIAALLRCSSVCNSGDLVVI